MEPHWREQHNIWLQRTYLEKQDNLTTLSLTLPGIVTEWELCLLFCLLQRYGKYTASTQWENYSVISHGSSVLLSCCRVEKASHNPQTVIRIIMKRRECWAWHPQHAQVSVFCWKGTGKKEINTRERKREDSTTRLAYLARQLQCKCHYPITLPYNC